MTSICTVLNGEKYGTEYVNKLYLDLKKHTTKPFKFYCYTDYDIEFLNEDINIIPIINLNKKLQWYKLDYFKKDIVDTDDIVLMDIDMHIIGNVDFLFDKVKDNEFRGTHRFWWRWREDKDNKLFALSGSVYKFKNGQHQYIVNEFEKDIKKWEEYFINNGVTIGPVNGEQHFVQYQLEKNKTNVSMFPEKHIVKWHNDDFYIQTSIEHAYKKYSGNNYILDDNWHKDVRIIHYAGN
tara:strand:+ start:3150 stop:3860 length:711 start_codon:yes stop_codon:yes gene_type:complete